MTLAASFNPSRLTWARRRRRKDQVELGALIGTSVRSIKAYEAGVYAPAAERLRHIARALHFPERFFRGDEIQDLTPKATFRAGSRLSAGLRDAALGSAAVAIAFNTAVERLFALPKADLAQPVDGRQPERWADLTRRKWDLGEGPIESMMQLLQAKGVRVFSLPADALDADTFSIWHGELPFIFASTAKRGDEQRFFPPGWFGLFACDSS